MLLQRKNDRRDASSRSVDAVGGGRARLRPGPLDAEQELRIDQNPLERELNPRVEAAALAPAVCEEGQQRLSTSPAVTGRR